MSGCAGYEVIKNDHLFDKNDVTHLRVPLFINRTIFPNISADFTNQIISRLGNLGSLKVNGGEPIADNEDVLVGILTSGPIEKDVLTPLIRNFTGNSSSLRQSIGTRPNFYLTSQYRADLHLELILIKDPLIKGNKVNSAPKVIFHHSIPISLKVVNSIAGFNGVDSPGVTNYTNNRGFFEYEIKKTAKRTAEVLENLIVL